jgi:type IV pilus assembly protein PilE
MKMDKKVQAYTLSELLVVLIIIGILVLIALPNLMPLITKTKATEAKLQLEHVYTLEKGFFYVNSKYTTDLNEIDFIQEPLVSQSENGKANYKIEVVSAGNTNYIAKATAVVDFDGDGTFNVWQIDQDKNLKEIVKD